MPVIEVSKRDFERLLGIEISLDELDEILDYVKCEIDEIVDENTIKIESKDTNRPDLWSVEGITRQLKGIIGLERGIPKIKVREGDYEVIVDEKVQKIRPYIGCLVAKDVNLDEDVLSSIIQQQEKIANSFGRKRKKVAIGFYILDKIEFPVYYTTAKPEEKMVPLYYSEEMTLKEILEKTEKGKEYGHLISSYPEYPVLRDKNGKIFGLLPIINSDDIGRIDVNTKNIFVDVSGTDLNAILQTLTILAYNLADRGAKIYSVKIKYPDGKIIETPRMEVKEKGFDRKFIERFIGQEFSDLELVDMLERYRYNVKEINSEKILVEIPPYRFDIISDVDLAEDIAIVYGYNNLSVSVPRFYSKGGLTEKTKFIETLKEICIGLGLIEVRNPCLTSKELLIEKCNRKYAEKRIVELENPVSSNYNAIRDKIYPQLLEFTSLNKKAGYPQYIFEVGRVVWKENNRIKEEDHLAILLISKEASYSLGRSYLEAILRNLGIDEKEIEIIEEDLGDFIPGRRAKILIRSKEIAEVGEIHPDVLEKFELELPVAIVEISIDNLYKLLKGK